MHFYGMLDGIGSWKRRSQENVTPENVTAGFYCTRTQPSLQWGSIHIQDHCTEFYCDKNVHCKPFLVT